MAKQVLVYSADYEEDALMLGEDWEDIKLATVELKTAVDKIGDSDLASISQDLDDIINDLLAIEEKGKDE